MNTTELRPLSTSADRLHGIGTDLRPDGGPTLQSLEAGLITLAHSLGREHAMRVRRAMNGVLLQSAAPTTTLPIEASCIGQSFDSNSLEQGGA